VAALAFDVRDCEPPKVNTALPLSVLAEYVGLAPELAVKWRILPLLSLTLLMKLLPSAVTVALSDASSHSAVEIMLGFQMVSFQR
jgi:hypothetical protein